MYLKPSEIFYSQDSVKSRFQCNRLIGDTLDEICDGDCTINAIPTISVSQRNGKWFTGDNRRLWVFKQLERLGKCPEQGIPVYQGNIFANKFTTVNDGISIRIRGGGNPGGRWHGKSAPRPAAYSSVRSNALSSMTSPGLYRSTTQSLGNRSSNAESISESRDYTSMFAKMGISTESRDRANPNYAIAKSVQRPPTRPVSVSRSSTRPASIADTRNDVRSSTNSRSSAYQYGQIYQTPIPISQFESFDDQGSKSDTTLLDPDLIRYTKDTISAQFDAPYRSVRGLAQKLKMRLKNNLDIQPIKVFKAFNEYWVTDGNRRVWAFKEVRRADRSFRILAKIDNDDEAFLNEIRQDRPWLSVIDILQMGEKTSMAA